VGAPLKNTTHAPVSVNEHHTRNAPRAELDTDAPVAHEHVKCIAVAFHKGGHFGVTRVFDRIEVDAQNAELVGREALVKRLHMRHRFAARTTENGPKIEHHHFSALRRQIHGTTIAQQPE
jgi:hypothetical protein